MEGNDVIHRVVSLPPFQIMKTNKSGVLANGKHPASKLYT